MDISRGEIITGKKSLQDAGERKRGIRRVASGNL